MLIIVPFVILSYCDRSEFLSLRTEFEIPWIFVRNA